MSVFEIIVQDLVTDSEVGVQEDPGEWRDNAAFWEGLPQWENNTTPLSPFAEPTVDFETNQHATCKSNWWIYATVILCCYGFFKEAQNDKGGGWNDKGEGAEWQGGGSRRF